MEEIDLGEIQRLVDELTDSGIDFQQMVSQGAKGGTVFSWENIAVAVQKIFLGELLAQKELWMHLIILAVAAAVLVHFADVFHSRSVSQISFCIIYMLMFLLLTASFDSSVGIAKDVLEAMRDFMTVLAPAYFLAMAMTSYVTSSGVYYEFVLLLISAVRWLTEIFILPCIEIYVLLMLVNHLSKEARLGRFADLTGMAVSWGLKAALTAVLGFHMIQGLVSPAADAYRASTISKGIEMVPVIGDIGSSVPEMVFGSAVLIKNGIGAAALVVLIVICLVPLTKLAVIMTVYYVLAAVLQPVSDERITGCLAGMGAGVKLLFQTVFTMLVLFFLSIALATALTGR